MRSVGLTLFVLGTMAAGCASARNTPAQDLAWERWMTCDHFVALTLDRIDRDGRLVVKAYESEAAAFSACVREAATDQVRRGIAAEPQAAVFMKIYGCTAGTL